MYKINNFKTMRRQNTRINIKTNMKDHFYYSTVEKKLSSFLNMKRNT